MKLSEGVEASIHCCAVLAGLEEQQTISGTDLADFHGVSASYLLKHLKKLVAANVLESVPGPAGGFRLARPADQITFLDIVLAVEGRAPAFRCSEIRRRGPSPLPDKAFPKPCGINAAMLKAERAWRDQLQATRLSDAVADHMTNSDAAVVQRGCAFIEAARRPRQSPEA
jgi:Rrf2 family protein